MPQLWELYPPLHLQLQQLQHTTSLNIDHFVKFGCSPKNNLVDRRPGTILYDVDSFTMNGLIGLIIFLVIDLDLTCYLS